MPRRALEAGKEPGCRAHACSLAAAASQGSDQCVGRGICRCLTHAPSLCPPPHSTFGVSCFNFWAIPTVFSCASLGLVAALGVFSSHPAASPLILRSIEHGCNAAGAAGLAGYASRRRRQLRQLEGLPEGPLSDWCTYFWCPSLTVCTVL